jgi:hypothetical protein
VKHWDEHVSKELAGKQIIIRVLIPKSIRKTMRRPHGVHIYRQSRTQSETLQHYKRFD